jgi:hypothetical protein
MRRDFHAISGPQSTVLIARATASDERQMKGGTGPLEFGERPLYGAGAARGHDSAEPERGTN